MTPTQHEKDEVSGEQIDFDGGHREHQSIADERPHHGQRRTACRKRRDSDAQLEAPRELLEHENRTRERRVECGSETRARAGGQQHPGIASTEIEHTPT
jgi:hypothetical protein